jgi:hypothetical protein
VCGETLTDRAELRAHWDIESGEKHRAHITNPTREERIEHEVDSIVDQYLDDILSDIQRHVDHGHLTEDEMRSAVRRYGDIDLPAAYDDWLDE